MNVKHALNMYSQVGIDSDAVSADPHHLVLMLYQGAIKAIANAKSHMMQQNVALKGKSLRHAMRIIQEGLNASLDKTAGGELANNLSRLYDHMSLRLLEANIGNDPAILDEVSAMLSDLKEAWSAIKRPQQEAEAAPLPAAENRRTGPVLVYGKV
jgi:flagellar protein FliS